MTEYVYLLETRCLEPELKIGRSWNVKVRMTDLSRAKRKSLFLIGVIPVECIESFIRFSYEVHQVEQDIHFKVRHLMSSKSKSEWYPREQKIIELFKNQPGFRAWIN